ncbi:transposase [Clostridium pasteurianum]|uniref:transposase n=1 Tax=Clostridium pasteurianum TaxID=1501 RepID=UPI002261019F|nr:transposase [Clostridium pasteurianum]UZW16035.1 transposase [Clostridium pasteurianum]
MPKKKLPWYPNAIYHVTSRGNRRSDIFRDDNDYLVYLENLKEAIEYYDKSYELISYTLMTNHIHLQIKTKEKHIWYLISRINKSYARNFNNKYNYVGHLFQSRYNAEIIEEDNYLLEVSRYIHLNPVRANMVRKPEFYKWSSYSMYIGSEKEKLICSDKILSYFKDRNRDLYKKYVESAINQLGQQ